MGVEKIAGKDEVQHEIAVHCLLEALRGRSLIELTPESSSTNLRKEEAKSGGCQQG